jgi:hypothetical protein
MTNPDRRAFRFIIRHSRNARDAARVLPVLGITSP